MIRHMQSKAVWQSLVRLRRAQKLGTHTACGSMVVEQSGGQWFYLGTVGGVLGVESTPGMCHVSLLHHPSTDRRILGKRVWGWRVWPDPSVIPIWLPWVRAPCRRRTMHSGLWALPPTLWRPEGCGNGEKTESDLFFKDAEDGLECRKHGDRENRRLTKQQ